MLTLPFSGRRSLTTGPTSTAEAFAWACTAERRARGQPLRFLQGGAGGCGFLQIFGRQIKCAQNFRFFSGKLCRTGSFLEFCQALRQVAALGSAKHIQHSLKSEVKWNRYDLDQF